MNTTTDVVNGKVPKELFERIFLLESHVRQYYTLVKSLTTVGVNN